MSAQQSKSEDDQYTQDCVLYLHNILYVEFYFSSLKESFMQGSVMEGSDSYHQNNPEILLKYMIYGPK